MMWETIAKGDLKIIFRDKMFLLWLLVFPLLFAFIFGLAFRDTSGGAQQVSLDIINQDKGFLSEALMDELKQNKYAIKIRGQITEETIRVLFIPEHFTSDILKGKQVTLELKQKEKRSLEAGQTAYSHVLKAIITILTRVVKTAPQDQDDLKARFNKNQLERLITLKTEQAGRAKTTPSGFTHSIPGSTIMFLLFTVLMYGGISILQERRRGILARLSISPASFTDIIAGKWASRVALGVIQIGILLAAGRLLFKVNLGTSIIGLFIIAVVFSSTIASLSIFLGSVFQKEETLIVINILLANLMAALGGCWWPLEIVPKTVKTIGFLLPTGWTMDAFNKLIFFGKGFPSVLPHIVVLAGFSLVFLILAVKFFKIQN